MRLILLMFVFILTNPIVNAQDTLMYNNYIDYYRSDYHSPGVKSTILTREGKFLKDGNYCFRGSKNDFDLLLKTLRRAHLKNYHPKNTSTIFLIGEIKDSIKVGVWKIEIHSKTENNAIETDTLYLTEYNKIPYPQRKKKFDAMDECQTTAGPVFFEVSCQKKEPTYFNSLREYNFVYPIKSLGGIKLYDRRNTCQRWIAEDKSFILYEANSKVLSLKMGDTIVTSFSVQSNKKQRINVLIKEVIKDEKLIYFLIDEEYKNLDASKIEKIKNTDIYSEIMYNLSKCWELE